MFRQLLTKVLGDPNERELRKLDPLVQAINALEGEFAALSEAELRAKTEEFKARLRAGESPDDLLPEAFAAVREAAKRTIGQRHFDVQLMGGIVLHRGSIAEMKTGEGKTLAATLPLYLNGLEGQGCHLVTPNDYLAKRDTQWMGQIYHALGLSVGVLQHEAAYLYDPSYPAEDDRLRNLRPISRREAYLADITYGTNAEFGFDHLRDNMVWDLSQAVQPELHYAIVDEVDNILIDEARTPLIISGPAEESTEAYRTFARLVERLRQDEGYTVLEKERVVTPTEEGIAEVERSLGIDNLYSPEHYELTHYLEQALRAKALFRRDRDYVVQDGEVIIVDEFTGRLMHGRRYSEGLHQAIEAKEGVQVQRESMTLATITIQNYFRMYKKLAGMTGTAATDAEEFAKIYNLEVVVIPTNMPMIRTDYPDQVYKSEAAKFRAVVREIEELHRKGQPVLVGTISVEKSEMLAEMLRQRGIPHNVLNAKQHEREAAVIAQAGGSGMVTIATNMAGRGVDIMLGGNPEGLALEELRKGKKSMAEATPQEWQEALKKAAVRCEQDRVRVLERGGLHVLGTERHEARRIDNQLRGRSGRQGDPGSSRFYVSLQDELMVRFGGPTIAGLMDRLGVDEDIPIEHDLVSKSIASAQVRVEGHNFDIRKHLLEYDDVINKQREVIYGQRRQLLSQESLKPVVLQMVQEEIENLVSAFAAADPEQWDVAGLEQALKAIMPLPPDFDGESLRALASEELKERLKELAERLYEERERQVGAETMRQIERWVMLNTVDALWMRHLTALDELREGIGLRAFGQQDPLVEYKTEAHRMFQSLLGAIRHDVAHAIYHVQVARRPERRRMQEVRAGGEEERGPQPARKAREGRVGRNDPCPCGSGKKYKNCCLRKELAAAQGEGRGASPSTPSKQKRKRKR